MTRICRDRRNSVYDGRMTKIKVTLAGSLVYYFNVWVGGRAEQEAILGMNFMVHAGVRLNLADGALCLPEEVRIHLAERRPAYESNIQHVTANDQHMVIPVGKSREVKIGICGAKMMLWVTRGLLGPHSDLEVG